MKVDKAATAEMVPYLQFNKLKTSFKDQLRTLTILKMVLGSQIVISS